MSELPDLLRFLIYLALVGLGVAAILMPVFVILMWQIARRLEARFKEIAPYVPAIHKPASESNVHLRNLTP